MANITAQMVDVGTGKPATDVAVTLEFHKGHGEWREVGTGLTNLHGVANTLTNKTTKIEAGKYRITFQTNSYFQALGQKAFFPYVTIVFEVSDPLDSYHIPLHISPFGFSACKG